MPKPIPTSLLGIYITGEHFQIRNLRTGAMIPFLFQTQSEAMDAQNALENGREPNVDVALRGEIDIAEALVAEIRAWDEVIAGVTVSV